MIETDYDIKTSPSDSSEVRIFYAGTLSEAKGLGDVFDAVAHLSSKGTTARLSVAGPGDENVWMSRARSLGIETFVTFLGKIPRASVLERMHAHDVVVVPSRWDYPEGLPNVVYEALATNTPLVRSDHPAFKDRLVDCQDCITFPAGNSAALANVLLRLTDDPALYKSLSENSADALQSLKFGLYWDHLWTLFLEDPAAKTNWVQKNSLAALKT